MLLYFGFQLFHHSASSAIWLVDCRISLAYEHVAELIGAHKLHFYMWEPASVIKIGGRYWKYGISSACFHWHLFTHLEDFVGAFVALPIHS